jgi:hypothetical protein
MQRLLAYDSSSHTISLRRDDSVPLGVLLLIGGFLLATVSWVFGVIDKNLPAALGAVTSMIVSATGMYFAFRKITSAERRLRDQELASYAETRASLSEMRVRYEILCQQFVDFKVATKEHADELRHEMQIRDELIKNLGWKSDELNKRIVTQSLMINSVEGVLKEAGFVHPRITAIYAEWNGGNRISGHELDTP